MGESRSRAISGVRSIRGPAGVRIDALLCAPARGAVAVDIARIAPLGWAPLWIADRAGLAGAMQVVVGPSAVLIDADAFEATPRELTEWMESIEERWPSAEVTAFSAERFPSWVPDFRRGPPVERLDHSGRPPDVQARRLAQRIGRGRAIREAQLLAGRDLAAQLELSPLASMLCVAIALRTPARFLPELLEQSPRRFHAFCSRMVYPRLGVDSLVDAYMRVLDFEARRRAERE